MMVYRRPSELYPENWNRLRFVVFKRDGFRCVICGSRHNLVCHHIIPVRCGGSHNLDNLITLCEDCHKKIHGIK